MILSNRILSLLPVAMLNVGMAHGATVVTNLANDTASAWTIGNGSTSSDSPTANQFTTGAGPGWTLDSVTLRLGIFLGPGNGTIEAFLAADNAGAPGANLTTLTGAEPTTSAEDLIYSPTSAQVLDPNTAYWVVTSASLGSSDGYEWSFTVDNAESGLAGWSIADVPAGGYPAGSWTPLDPGGPAPTQFQIDATPIPEPSSAFLIGLAIFGAATLCKRRKLE